MLQSDEKAYCRALEALRKRDYVAANREFEAGGCRIGQSAGFRIIVEATRMLAELERRDLELDEIDSTTIKEIITHGEETIIRR